MTDTLKRLSYSHEAMVDLILQEPSVTTKELASLFNLSQGWVARVLASDSFQARLAERKAQLIDPLITQSLHDRLKGVAVHALDIVSEKLDAEASASYAIDALGLATAAMGVAARAK